VSSTNEKVTDALQQVRTLIEVLVRHEQLQDGLTQLPNDAALTEEFESAIGSKAKFWCAFVEIDHFKRLNDSFSYLQADAMLKRVAAHLKTAADYFPEGARAFRAHGDEFYLVGRLVPNEESGTIEANLERIRSAIEGVRIRVGDRPDPMQCTVSIGWVSTDAVSGAELTNRGVRIVLERAVAHAKRRGRNCVVHYSEDMKKTMVNTIRDTCTECQVAFTVDVSVAEYRTEHLFCPNCGYRIKRPAALPRPSEPRFA